MPDEPYHIVFERHGGVGDVLFTTPVLRYYRTHPVEQAAANGFGTDRPLRITFSTQQRNDFIFRGRERLIDERIELFPLQYRLHHKTVDDAAFVRQCRENQAKIRRRPDAIISFFEAVERNDFANHINVYDWHLQWAGIDPESVKPGAKRPAYQISPKESDRAERILSRCPGAENFRIAIQMHASSLPRTWDKNDRLIKAICRRWPEIAVYSFGDEVARMLELTPPERPSNYMPLCGATKEDRRLWAAMIGGMNLLITVDSGAMHIAGALGIPLVGLFSTVPGWTRLKYYYQAIAIDSDCSCAPCFRIGMECARSIPTPGIDWIPSMNIRGKNETYPCLSNIGVEQVMAAVEKQVEQLWTRKSRKVMKAEMKTKPTLSRA